MIHIFKEQDGSYQVWSDCASGERKSGRCLACGQTPHEAVNKASVEMEGDYRLMFQLRQMVSPPVLPSPD